MLILKNVTAVQLHPAKVQEGVDIAIENDVIIAIHTATLKPATKRCMAGL